MASIDKVEKNFKKIKNRYFYKYQIEHKKKFKIIIILHIHGFFSLRHDE